MITKTYLKSVHPSYCPSRFLVFNFINSWLHVFSFREVILKLHPLFYAICNFNRAYPPLLRIKLIVLLSIHDILSKLLYCYISNTSTFNLSSVLIVHHKWKWGIQVSSLVSVWFAYVQRDLLRWQDTAPLDNTIPRRTSSVETPSLLIT